MLILISASRFFFFNDTATTEIYTLSLHDALPICEAERRRRLQGHGGRVVLDDHPPHDPLVSVRRAAARLLAGPIDRKSTRLNFSHANISYAVFCLKKKKKVESYKYNSREICIRYS